MTTTEAAHKHMFPFEKPGVFGDYGPCECGLTREEALAIEARAGADRAQPGRRDLRAEEMHAEWHGWMAAQGYDITDDDRALAEAFAAGMQAERDLAAAMNAAEPEGSPNRAVPVTAAMLAADFGRRRLVIVDREGMPFTDAEIAADIIAGFAGDMRANASEAKTGEDEPAALPALLADRNHLRETLRRIALGTAGGSAAALSVVADKALTASRDYRDQWEPFTTAAGL
jgi:hypothetical protein